MNILTGIAHRAFVGRNGNSARGVLFSVILWPLIAFVAAVVGWSVLLSGLEQERQQVEKAALADVSSLSRSYAEQLKQKIQSIDLILRHLRFEWQLSKGQLKLETVKEEAGLLPSTSFFYAAIVNEQGMPVTHLFPDRPKPYLGDREHFGVHKRGGPDQLFIGEPIMGRVSERKALPFSRPIFDSAGNFAGTVLVSVASDYFVAGHDDTGLGKNGLIGVVGYDNRLHAMRRGQRRDTREESVFAAMPPLSLQGGTELLGGPQWFVDGRSRYVSWQPVGGYPLIALAALDRQDRFAAYRAYRQASLRNAVISSVFLGLFTLLAMFLSARLAWRKQQMEQIQSTYRMATEGGNEGFYIACPVRSGHGSVTDFRIVDCNRRAAEFFHLRPEEMIGKNVSDFYRGERFQHAMGSLRQAWATGSYEGEWKTEKDDPVSAPWMHVKMIRADNDIAITMRDITETKMHVEELERRSNQDALTGLPNRRWAHAYLRDAVDHAQAAASMLAILYIDLDGFKSVNDTMGHAVGDELLKHAAKRLKLAVRPHDHVVRLGGDEFLVVIEHITEKSDAAHVAERILRAFKESFRLSKGLHSIGTSIGISLFPFDGSDAERLLECADIAMYSVKTSGKRAYRFYDPKFYEGLRARLEKEAELRYAVEHDQFVMYYQPRVDIASGNISSMEALVRWAHPLKGLLEPNDFIPLAEETDLILPLGELVVDKVCAQLAYWAKRGQDLVPVSINVSPRQFNRADMVRLFSASLERHRVDPRLIEIELTESSMMGENEDVSEALAAIRRMGTKLLVDDFGTGYSSLAQLQRLDFDVLKVDRAFTREIEKTEEGKVFFTAIITMAHALGMCVVAEGVENENQVNILRALKCDEVQGFYVARPMPASDTQPIFANWLTPSIA